MTTFNSSINGSYRVNNTYFPTPPETEWEEQEIALGLNGIPINGTYRIHRWNFDELEGFLVEELYSLFADQQSGNSQLSELETDPYDASGADSSYGTETYTDFIIIGVSTRTRGLPNYQNVSVIFEVAVS